MILKFLIEVERNMVIVMASLGDLVTPVTTVKNVSNHQEKRPRKRPAEVLHKKSQRIMKHYTL
jgi:hypothetical protein